MSDTAFPMWTFVTIAEIVAILFEKSNTDLNE